MPRPYVGAELPNAGHRAAALIVAAAVGGSDSAFGSAVGGVGVLIVRLIGALFFGLIVGTLLAFLGSYVAFDRNKALQGVAGSY